MKRHATPAVTDAALLRSSQSNADAFHKLYLRHVDRVHAHLLRRTRDEHASRDLAAETFARAWVGRTRFRDDAGGSALPWLLGIAHYVMVESVRKQRMEREARDRLGMLERVDRPEEQLQPSPTWDTDVEALISDLPEAQRELLRLRFVEDRAFADVADILGVTEQNARVRMHRALNVLRTQFSGPNGSTR